MVAVDRVNEICQCFHPDLTLRGKEQCEANVRLIASAPEMLEALKNLNAMFDGDGFRPDLADGLLDKLQAADAAIAKAEGTTPRASGEEA